MRGVRGVRAGSVVGLCGVVDWLQGPQLGYRAVGWHLYWRGRDCVRRKARGIYGEWSVAVGVCGTWVAKRVCGCGCGYGCTRKSYDGVGVGGCTWGRDVGVRVWVMSSACGVNGE